MGGWTDGWTSRWMGGCMDGWVGCRWLSGQTGRWTDK